MKRNKPKVRVPRQTNPPHAAGSGWGTGPRLNEHARPPKTDAPAATVELEFPITFCGRTRSSVDLRHPTVADIAWFRRQPGTLRARIFALAGRLSGMRATELDELDTTDAVTLADACSTILEGL